jgi:hypothetical protein
MSQHCPPCHGHCNQGDDCPVRTQHRQIGALERQLARLIAFACAAIIGTMVLTFAPPAAADTTIGLHIATAHFGADLKAATPGVYIRNEAGFTAGVYRNSYSRTSTYAGWTWQTEDKRFALTAGAVTGYPAAKLMPLIVPSVRFEVAHGIAARIAFIPKPAKHGRAAGLHLALEREF